MNGVCSIQQFRPITCCNVIYKINSEVLTSRLQKVICHLISPEQQGFIPGRQISNNILLASELIKGYGMKNMSPRSMVMIDLRKVYDSVEWPILLAALKALAFPDIFVRWVMSCVLQFPTQLK